MTLQTTGTIAVSDVNTEIGLSSTYSDDLAFLNNKIVAVQRPAAPNLGAFYGLTNFQNNTQGNCNNVNAAGVNCDCGNVNCSATANCININCTNCDTQQWLQTNCNCACTYNCTNSQNCFSYNCNCNCSKIICTKLYELRLLPKDIFEADQAYGELLKVNHPDIYNGYTAWAEIVVDWMGGKGPNMMPWLPEVESRKRFKDFAIRWAYDIATPWAEYMAYKMGVKETTNKTGLVLMIAGTSICKIVGMWQKIFGKSKKSAGFGKGCILMTIFISLKIIIEIGKLFGNRTKSLVRGNA
jgi:hypothetical protein